MVACSCWNAGLDEMKSHRSRRDLGGTLDIKRLLSPRVLMY